MLAKGWISQQESDGLIPDVELRGPAKDLLRKKDTLAGFSSGMIREVRLP
jgi:hypothetical protein